jgi:putative N6-adenine-specific DNA methylase
MNYGFMHILGYDEEVFLTERRLLKEQVVKQIDFKIIASDISEDAIDISIKNAMTAGVDHLIEFRECDFSETEIPEGKGVVMFNPEYGERLGEQSELEVTYKRIGDFMKQKCKGYQGFIFTGNPDLAKKIGLQTPESAMAYGGIMGTSSGVAAGLAATDTSLVPYGSVTATFYTGLGCLICPSLFYLILSTLLGA